jgi:threonine dehydrogenase-like Zn-dependent dehydrogenase
MDLIEKGIVKTGRYMTHRFPLDEIDAAEKHEGLKVIVTP